MMLPDHIGLIFLLRKYPQRNKPTNLQADVEHLYQKHLWNSDIMFATRFLRDPRNGYD